MRVAIGGAVATSYARYINFDGYFASNCLSWLEIDTMENLEDLSSKDVSRNFANRCDV